MNGLLEGLLVRTFGVSTGLLSTGLVSTGFFTSAGFFDMALHTSAAAQWVTCKESGALVRP